jgi:hypothetical protein
LFSGLKSHVPAKSFRNICYINGQKNVGNFSLDKFQGRYQKNIFKRCRVEKDRNDPIFRPVVVAGRV